MKCISNIIIWFIIEILLFKRMSVKLAPNQALKLTEWACFN